MTADAPTLEKVAGAMPAAALKGYVMGTVLPVKMDAEARHVDPILLIRVALRLLDLADET
jgi:hypothetical protein